MCYKRHGFESIPGCTGGGENDVFGKSYCVDPRDLITPAPTDAPTQKPSMEPTVSLDLRFIGREACHPHSPCNICVGDCDYDEDCKGDLRCAQRENAHQHVPGCKPGGYKTAHTDYCKYDYFLRND